MLCLSSYCYDGSGQKRAPGHFRFDKSNSPWPLAATIDNGIVKNCGCVEFGSVCAKLKITLPFDGVAYIIPCGVWQTKGERIDGCWEADDTIEVDNDFGVFDVDDKEIEVAG